MITGSLSLAGFLLGWVCACILLQRQFAIRQDHLKEQISNDIIQWNNRVKSIRQHIYIDAYSQSDDPFLNVRSKLDGFVPSKETEYVSLAYVGGMSAGDQRLILHGNGDLYSEFRGKSQLIFTISNERCTSFFRDVLKSGLIDYSAGVVTLKQELLAPKKSIGATDRPITEICIAIPQLDIEKRISVYAPDIELEQFSDIIEFQLVIKFQKKILELVPGNQPPWKK